jgi:hypothetical protein
MSLPERRYEGVVSAVVIAAFAAFWMVAFAAGDPPEFRSQYLYSAILMAMLATPWVIAARLLWRAWWARHAASLHALDGPARLLAAAVATLPAERRDWGAAMAAELAHVEGRSARWWFAAGCARAALFPPCVNRGSVLVVGGLSAAAVMTCGLAVGRALPAMQVFAVAFTGLAGGLSTLAVARSGRLYPGGESPVLACGGLAAVAACVAVTAHFLIRNPAAAEHLPPSTAVVLAVVLAGGLGLALIPPHGLATSRVARGLGAGGAVTLGLGFFATSRLTVHTNGGPFIWVIFAPPVIFFAASAAAGATGRSFRAGLQTVAWTALAGTLVVYAITVPEALHRYAIDGRTLGDGETGYPIGVNLADAVWGLVVIPILGLPFGVIGAAVGRRLRAGPPLPPALAENQRC